MKRMLMAASVPSMIGQFNMENIQLLQKLGYEVDVACNFADRSVWGEERIARFQAELDQKGIRRFQVDFSRRAFGIAEHVTSYHQLKEILAEGRYEFLHCHTPVAGALARIAGHAAKTKVIYTAHGFHFYKGAPLKNWLLFYPVERFLSRWTDVLITINREDYERAKKFPAGRVEYVPGVGIDLEKIESLQVDRAAKRKELGIPEDAYVLLSVGELNKNKNHETVISALAGLKNESVHYAICGQGSRKKYLENESEKLGVKEQVHLLGFRRDVYEIYKACDVFLHPSYREGLPVAVMEAMASGLPCIVSNIRGNRDLIHNRINGITIPLNRKQEWKTEIERMMNDPDKRERMREKSRKAVSAYSRQAVSNRVEKLYREVIEIPEGAEEKKRSSNVYQNQKM